MQLLDGRLVSAVTREKIKQVVQTLPSKPCLAVVLVGDDPASKVYVQNKIKACEELNIISKEIRLAADTTREELKHVIDSINKDPKIHAYLVQLPLPKHLSKDEVISWIDPRKDADGLTTLNLGYLFAGLARVEPCTPKGVMEILSYYNVPLEGKNAVVIGRSHIVGLPMAHLLLNANATVTVCHSKTKNLLDYTQKADVVVVAAGRPEFIGKDAFSKNCVVIDVGIHRVLKNGETKLCGDVHYEQVKDHVAAITPVPGGVGPMTITMLLKNTVELYKLQNNL